MKIGKNAKKRASNKNGARALAAAVAAGAAASWSGVASVPANGGAIQAAGTINGTRADGPFTIGTQFTVAGNTTITISELGVQDQNNGNGTVGYTNTGSLISGIVAGSTTVGIWSGNGTLLAKAVVTSNDLLGAGDYRYDTTLLNGNGTAISPITLSAGNYTIGAVVGGGVAYFNDAAGATSGTAGVTVGNATFIGNGTTLTYPTSAGGGGTGRWAAANGFVATPLTAGVGNGTLTDYSIADTGSTLTLNAASTPGVASLQIAAAGGTLDLGANTLTIANNNLEMTGSGNYTIQNGTISGSNANQSLVVIQAGSGTLNLNSVIGGGAAGFVKLGIGTVVLGATNTYTGATVVGSGGTLQLGGASQLASGSYAGAILNSGTLQYSSTASQIFSGAISGTGALIKDTSSSSVLTLANANSYTGNTTVGTGTLIVGTAGSLGANSPTTVNSTGTLIVASGGGNTTRTLANSLTLSGGTVGVGLDNAGSGGNITFSGGNVIHTFTGNGTLTLAGNVTGASELIVGGGGGSSGQVDGDTWGSGGGGGNVTNVTGASISAGSLPVTVGAGGAAGLHASGSGTAASAIGGNGTASSFNGTTDAGGVGGQATAIASGAVGGASGSGQLGGAASGPNGGGGAGASGPGGNATSGAAGVGGNGTIGTITGLTYGTGGIGQSSGGGSNQPGASGTGNGGGGTAGTVSPPGTAGGSGIVIVQYAYNAFAGAGSVILSGNISDTATSTLDAYGSGGSLTTSGVISGVGGINITSSNNAGGVVSFSGNNTYRGATAVQSGATLKLSGAFANNIGNSTSITLNSGGKLDVTGLTSTAGTLTLASGQVLGGTGNVTGAIVVASGSKISAGNSTTLGTGSGNATGMLTTGNETWKAGGTYAVKMNNAAGASGNASGFDDLSMALLDTSALGTSTTFAITLTSSGTAASNWVSSGNQTWVIANIGNGTLPVNTILAVTNSAGSSTGTSPSSLFTLDTSSFVANNAVFGSGSSFYLEALGTVNGAETLEIGYNATPEPGTAMLVLTGAVPMLLRRRRRQQLKGEE